MSSTLYVLEMSPRSQIVSDLAKYLKLNVKVVTDRDSDPRYTKSFPLNKAPAFIGKDDFKLTETLAILYYFITVAGDRELEKQLLGSTAEEKADVLRWVSFANSDLASAVFPPVLMQFGVMPFNKDLRDSSLAKLEKSAEFYDQSLSKRSFLASESTITLGDLISYYFWALIFQGAVGSDFRNKHPELMTWFNAVGGHPLIKSSHRDFSPKEKASSQ